MSTAADHINAEWSRVMQSASRDERRTEWTRIVADTRRLFGDDAASRAVVAHVIGH